VHLVDAVTQVVQRTVLQSQQVLSDVSLSILTAIFPRKPGSAGFIEAKDDGSGGDNWSYKSCKAPVKSSPLTNKQTNTQLFTGQMPFLSSNQQCQSTEGRISHFTDLLTPSLLGVFQLCH